MPLNQKISELTEKVTINANDNLPIVDSEEDPIESKKIKFSVIYNLFALVGHNHAGVYEPVIGAGLATQYWRGDKAWATLNQAAVAGLTTADTPTFDGLNIGAATGAGKGEINVSDGNLTTAHAYFGINTEDRLSIYQDHNFYLRLANVFHWQLSRYSISPYTNNTKSIGTKDYGFTGLYLAKATAPSTNPTGAVLYTDTADGDLKVLFANGTTKTIETD